MNRDFGNAILLEDLKTMKKLIKWGKAHIDDQNELGDTALTLACHFGLMRVFKFAISLRCNLNIQNEEGESALLIAIINGKIEFAKKLINMHASLDLQRCDGSTALMHACRQGDVEIVDMLLDRGATRHLTDKYGLDALSYVLLLDNTINRSMLEKRLGVA
jgi:ankyrin repeat protein